MHKSRYLTLILLWNWLIWSQPVLADDAPTVEAEQSAFRLADPNLKISMVASEPSVASPVAIAWDEFKRLYVVEMTDYPADGSGGQIKRLEDRDGDGIYEKFTLFAEKLAYPSGVLPWNGGILVTSAPDLIFLKDTDGDGKADQRKVILTGFGEGNQQLRVNSPTWGLDNWIYLANGRSGGAIRRPNDAPDKAVNIARNDIRVRPATGEFQPIAGFSQFGLPRDDWGNRFPSWNTVPIRHVVIENNGPSTGQVAEILNMDDGGRLYSLAPAQQRFNGETVAFFNATCGPVINRDSRLGANYQGHAFVCEPLSSLIHHRQLQPSGPTFVAQRVEQGREFLASAHPWFRPVNLSNGPDGSLYVVDFCRAWVEHPAFVPEKQRDSVDFREGHQRGRIWKIQSINSQKPEQNIIPGALETKALVDLLEHPNSWYRDTAQRLIVERQDLKAIEPLRQICQKSTQATAVVQALWTLAALNAIDDVSLKSALHSNNENVREQAVRIINIGRPDFKKELETLASDSSIRVRLQVVLALANLKDKSEKDLAALATIASRDADSPWIRSAVIDAIHQKPLVFLGVLMNRNPEWISKPTQMQSEFLEQVARDSIGKDLLKESDDLIILASNAKNQRVSIALANGLLQSINPQQMDRIKANSQIHKRLNAILDQAEAMVKDEKGEGWSRALALNVLANSRLEVARQFFIQMIKADKPIELQATCARLFPKIADEKLLKELFKHWNELSLATRRSVVTTVASSLKFAPGLVDAMAQNQLSAAEIDPASRNILRKLGDPAFQTRVANTLKDAPTSDRKELIRKYEPALSMSASTSKGKMLFEKNCQTCHSYRGKGARVGPELVSVAGKNKLDLMISILDPARDASPDGMGVIVLTKDGRTLSGLLIQENASMIRLRRAEGLEDEVARAEIEAIRSTGRSLMPEGLEQVLNHQDIADLIGFLRDLSGGQ